MKLIKCYVSSFGKLKDFSIDLNDGVNVIKEDNGWGKSTLSTFIKAMFYGLKGANKHSLTDNERKKYKPWNSTEKFGGYVDFEKDGNIYRIERFFGNKETEDEIKVIDVKTGKSFINTDGIGERIFGIDEDGFFSTTYFSEKDFEITGNTSLTSKYNSVCGVESSDAFDDAVSKLENKIKTYKIRGGKGLIEDTRQEVKAVMEDLERSSRAVDTAKALKDEILVIENKISILQSEINRLGEKLSNASKAEALEVKRKIYLESVKEKQKIENDLAFIEKSFNGYFPELNEVKAYVDCYKDFTAITNDVNNLKREIDQISAKTPEKVKSNAPIIYSVFILAVVLFGVLGGVLISISLPISITMFVLAAICGVALSFIAIKKPFANAIKTDDLSRVEELKNTLLGYTKIANEYKGKITLFISKFVLEGDDDYSKLLNLKEKISEREMVLKNLSQINQRLRDFEKDLDLSVNTEIIESTEELSRIFKEKQDELSVYNRTLAEKKTSYSRMEEITSAIPDLENKKAQLIERGIQYTDEYNVLTKTLDFMKMADENLKIKYRQPLENSFNK